MATFKAIFPYQKQDGSTRVFIQMIHNRKIRKIKTEIFTEKSDFSRAGNLKNISIKDDVDAIIKDYHQKVRKLGTKTNLMTADQICDYLNQSEADYIDLIEFSKIRIQKLHEQGRVGTAKTYEAALASLINFLGRDSLDINQFTAKLLIDYAENFLKSRQKSKTIKTSSGRRALSLYTTIFKTLINQAKVEYNDEDNGIILVRVSPFSKFKIPSYELPKKRSLPIEQIRAIRDAEIPAGDKRKVLGRDIFMLSFYLCGINSVDLFNDPLFKDGRLIYKRMKTKDRRKDSAEMSLKIEPEAQQILMKYMKGEKTIFSKLYANHLNFNRNINKGLTQLAEDLGMVRFTFYSARHSWATIAINDCHIDKYVVHQALNHVDQAMKVTDFYITKDWSMIDRANRKVLDLIKEIVN
ncbi:MAG: site-specific integrase [Bacteroidetes bacterium]|nr:site-specific integrase [Bacteroidota bacterium]